MSRKSHFWWRYKYQERLENGDIPEESFGQKVSGCLIAQVKMVIAIIMMFIIFYEIVINHLNGGDPPRVWLVITCVGVDWMIASDAIGKQWLLIGMVGLSGWVVMITGLRLPFQIF